MDRNDETIDGLRRAMRLIVEVMQGMAEATAHHTHDRNDEPPNHRLRSAINVMLGKLDAIASVLEHDPKPDGSDAGGEGRDG